jgi:hypothetical protein
LVGATLISYLEGGYHCDISMTTVTQTASPEQHKTIFLSMSLPPGSDHSEKKEECVFLPPKRREHKKVLPTGDDLHAQKTQNVKSIIIAIHLQPVGVLDLPRAVPRPCKCEDVNPQSCILETP